MTAVPDNEYLEVFM